MADKTIAKLEAFIGAVQKRPMSEIGQDADEVSDAALAQWWLDFGITRKITKRNCMTVCQVVADMTIAKLKAILGERNDAKRQNGTP